MKIMQATLIKSLDELVVGAYNILTVKEENLRIIKPQDIDFILVPAVGLDKKVIDSVWVVAIMIDI